MAVLAGELRWMWAKKSTVDGRMDRSWLERVEVGHSQGLGLDERQMAMKGTLGRWLRPG